MPTHVKPQSGDIVTVIIERECAAFSDMHVPEHYLLFLAYTGELYADGTNAFGQNVGYCPEWRTAAKESEREELQAMIDHDAGVNIFEMGWDDE